ncbi:MAG: hypothetical protein H6747_05585 [Deltaproteobacteria bacterium]|nr:hypothetical protein [Deltaproteobacteria bacterium]
MRTAIILGATAMLLTSTAMAWVFTSDDGAGATPLRSRGDLDVAEQAGPGATPSGAGAEPTTSARAGADAPTVTRDQERAELPAAIAGEAPDLRLPTALPALPERDPNASAPGAYARAAAIIDRVEQTARTSIARLEKLRQRHSPIETVFQDELRSFAAAIDKLGEDYKAIEPLLSETDRAALEAEGKSRLEVLLPRFVALNKMPEPPQRVVQVDERHGVTVEVETIIE